MGAFPSSYGLGKSMGDSILFHSLSTFVFSRTMFKIIRGES